jgi:hypothetical protein
MKISPMERNTIRRCEAVAMVRHEAFGKHPQQCRNDATAWVDTSWHAAKRTASLNGSAITRFVKRHAACDAHATAAVARVELLSR